MRGLTPRSTTTAGPGAIETAPVRRRGTLVGTLVLALLVIMIVRDIVVRRWAGTSASAGASTRSR